MAHHCELQPDGQRIRPTRPSDLHLVEDAQAPNPDQVYESSLSLGLIQVASPTVRIILYDEQR